MKNDLILYKKENRIAFITINRPEVYNALSQALLSKLDRVLEKVRSDSDIGAVIITGAGERVFVSGGDINELAAMDSSLTGWKISRDSQSVLNNLERLGKPSIAAIGGYCLGGGLELALACTLRIASEDALLGLPELGLGLVPAFGGTQRLIRLVGKGKAAEMILTAKPVDAGEAFRIGLVNRVVSPPHLLATAKEMAESILKNGTEAISLAMHLMLRGGDLSLDNSLAFESAVASLTVQSAEANQRMKAFLKKK